MPSAFRNQKNLHEWIELDYFERPRPLRRWRRPLFWATFLVLVGAVAALWFWPKSTLLVQAGPVSSAHAMFNQDCWQCHQVPFETTKKLLPGNAAHPAVPDKACIQCHDGPLHNNVLLESDNTSCASCHREHRGDLPLARVPDNQCTSCHEDLKKHRKGGDVGLAFENVGDFIADHPEFAVWRKKETDPGRILFNHKAHLKDEGIFIRMPDGGRAKRTLQCAECHQTDSAGRYMQPIVYDNHCASCHPLSVQLVGNFDGPVRLKDAVETFNHTPVPHRSPEIVRGVLRERLLSIARDFPMVLKAKDDGKVDKGVLGRPNDPLSPTQQEWTWIVEQLDPLQARLFPDRQLIVNDDVLFKNGGGCRFCHIEAKREEAKPNPLRLPGLPVYEETNLRKRFDRVAKPVDPPANLNASVRHRTGRWMPHGKFDHQSHRMLACAECHDAQKSEKTGDILMPMIGSCKQCHNPSRGVRNDCAECHNYHDFTRWPETPKNKTIEECLGQRK